MENALVPESDLTKLQELPVLDVRGTRDRVISVHDGIRTQHLTGAEIAFVSEAGHLPFCERPDEFMFVVKEFLMDHDLL